MTKTEKKLSQVKALIFDVDGVFAKPQFYLHPSGEFMRSMNTKDGYVVQLAVKKGFPIGIITGAKSNSIGERFKGLGVTDIYLGSHNKIQDYEDFKYKYDLCDEQILYMGDDIPDYEVMKKVGFPACPADAVPEIKQIAIYTSPIKGGEGCVRDIIQQLLRARGHWMDIDAFHLHHLKVDQDTDIS